MHQMKYHIILGFLAIVLVGCTGPKIVPTNAGTFRIESNVTIFDSEDRVMELAEEFSEAGTRFCATQNMTIEITEYSFRKLIPFWQRGSALLEFKCVPKLESK